MKHESNFLIERREQKNGKAKSSEIVKKKTIPKRSKKMAEIIKRLVPRYKIFLSIHKICNIQFDKNCTVVATVVNHTRGRGANIENESDWEASCVYCNGAIEKDHNKAGDHKKKRNGEVIRNKF